MRPTGPPADSLLPESALVDLGDAPDVGVGILLLGKHARLPHAACGDDGFEKAAVLGEDLDFELMHVRCSCGLLFLSDRTGFGND